MSANCDNYFTDVVLLLNFNGEDGDTTTVDSSQYANAVNFAQAGATLTTSLASPVGATTVAYFDHVGAANENSGFAAVPVAENDPLDMSNVAEWTIECWGYIPTAVGATSVIFVWVGDANTGGNVQISATASGSSPFITAVIGGAATGIIDVPNYSASPGDLFDTWFHIALVKNSAGGGNDQYQLFVNGVGQGYTSGTIHGPYTPWAGNFVAAGSYNGSYSPSLVAEGTQYSSGVRVTSGVARYTSNFTPPTMPFPLYSCYVPPVPDVIGESISVATANIEAAGFIVGSVGYLPDVLVNKNNVLEQAPSGGVYAAPGSPVNLVLSSGRAGLFVPLLLDLSFADAIESLTTIGLVVGAIGYQPSNLVPVGEVMLQNPTAGTPVAYGSLVSFVISTGPASSSTAFNVEATVISQYANSPTLTQLIMNLSEYFDQSTNFANFYSYIWNIDTAVGFGLDIWGKIVGVSRLLLIPNTTDYVGFDNSATPPPDWQTMGSSQPPYNDPPVGGAMYTGYNATTAYLLPDDAYRQLILAKAFANICTTTAPAINQILQNLFGTGNAWVLNTGVMSISYNLNFTPSAIQLAILEQSGVIPTPPGVSFVVNTDV